MVVKIWIGPVFRSVEHDATAINLLLAIHAIVASQNAELLQSLTILRGGPSIDSVSSI